MGRVLDTNVIIEIARGNKKVLNFVISRDRIFYMTSITRFEIMVGFPKRLEILLINRLPTLPFDEKAADIASFIFKELKSRGKIPPIKDLFIAATCISNNIPLITLDKDFLLFEEFGLDVEIIE